VGASSEGIVDVEMNRFTLAFDDTQLERRFLDVRGSVGER
jgi:hypothetical protein